MKTILISIVISLLFIGCEARVGMNVASDGPERYIVICIEGHQYYSDNYRQLAIHLDDNGKPVDCVVKE